LLYFRPYTDLLVQLVTHALHFLPEVDYIIVLADGRIAERGTYAELMADNGTFSALVRDFGGSVGTEDEEKKETVDDEESEEKRPEATAKGKQMLMQQEERATGSVPAAGTLTAVSSRPRAPH
jgi:ABC-type multidrug transport system ATPase subunit